MPRRRNWWATSRIAGVTWCHQAESVNTYDFIHDAQCRATPYAVYDVNRNRGTVAVGISADTAQFATDCLTRWWQGRRAARRIRRPENCWFWPMAAAATATARGSSSRPCSNSQSQWLAVTVCHYPTGASKWNPVEHRLLSQISRNWAGQPLRSLDTMLGYIRGTSTATGLRVRAWLNPKTYPTKVKVPDAHMKLLNLRTSAHVSRLELHHPTAVLCQRALSHAKMRSYSCTPA